MNTSLSSSTTTDKTLTTHHGKFSSFEVTQVMDIDTDGSRLPNRDRDPDAMEISLDLNHDDKVKGEEPANAAATAAAGPEVSGPHDTREIFERPREEEALPKVSDEPAQRAQKPHLTQDLFSLFDLQPLAASVARTDPVTGEKINKMRKSYEGKVKTFGLAGRNRAVKHEQGKPMGLLEMATWPEEEWQNQKVAGKEVAKGFSSETLSKLERAMQMLPGEVPKNSEWEDLLGHEKAKPLSAVAEHAPRSSVLQEAASAKPNGQINGARMTTGKGSTTEIVRPKRSGRKRRYDEHSFEGYGEGYVDDDGEMMGGGGYSSGEGSPKSSTSKKQKKSYGGAGQPSLGDRSGSYSVGMVGMSSSIGAYGR